MKDLIEMTENIIEDISFDIPLPEEALVQAEDISKVSNPLYVSNEGGNETVYNTYNSRNTENLYNIPIDGREEVYNSNAIFGGGDTVYNSSESYGESSLYNVYNEYNHVYSNARNHSLQQIYNSTLKNSVSYANDGVNDGNIQYAYSSVKNVGGSSTYDSSLSYIQSSGYNDNSPVYNDRDSSVYKSRNDYSYIRQNADNRKTNNYNSDININMGGITQNINRDNCEEVMDMLVESLMRGLSCKGAGVY